MKKTLLTAALEIVQPMTAHAGAPRDAGKTFAQITACHIARKLDRDEKVAADFAVIKKYKIAKKGDWWKGRMEDGKREEFKRLNKTNDLELGIMCGIIKNKWT
ncbi:hypothetical protein OQJ65_17120 [Vibrio sp. Sgm 22]|uniref:hypothetical protein n=1 Tax=unclassified Vibrio TaxID=2614977 RepID=UPI0022489A62|nr:MULTISPECIES: hypothetical protein [unclassified Vibrio]MCX2760057.1 hypothetical protein [Vibrio sp. 14G-20]MCX2777045.1 hypothetical protein [Vibrio sp. Sgm 22]